MADSFFFPKMISFQHFIQYTPKINPIIPPRMPKRLIISIKEYRLSLFKYLMERI